MSQSNVPALSIISTGVTVPQSGEVQAGVLADINAAFGGNLDIVTVGTPQEALSEDITEYIQGANGAIADMVSQFDPNNAQGRIQDALARIYFLFRNGATASVVTAQVVGAPNTTLPAGAQALDTNQNVWISTAAATYSGAGTANVQFACQTLGPVALGVGQLTQIVSITPGVSWDAITNATAAVLGSNTETPADFEYRRQQSVAANAQGSPAAILGAVIGVANVSDCFVIDNPKGSVVNYGPTNYPLAANSVYVAVVGGTAAAVAQAIWTKKDLGCNYNGNTEQNVTDTSSLANPQPVYVVEFEQPNALSVQFAVSLAANSNLPSNITALVQAAIVSSFAGEDGGPRARIGSTLFASRFYANVAAISPFVQILSILIGSNGGGATNQTVSVGIDQYPTLAVTDIVVTT